MSPLMSWEEARVEVLTRVRRTSETETVKLTDAVGRVMARDLIASDANPRFDNAAVDGYAVGRAEDAAEGARLRLTGSLAAGSGTVPQLEPRSACRILTGAMVPLNCYGITMQEDVTVEGETITLKERIKPRQHVRVRGEDFSEGELLISMGAVLNPGSIALLASMGSLVVEVLRRPRCAIVTTGDELVRGELTPGEGMIRDSNGPMLSALAHSVGVHSVTESWFPDDRKAITGGLKELASDNDFLIVAGGASVGDRDHVPSALKEIGEVWFHGVSMKPGKPILFGQVGGCWAFALPGNPASAFVGFHVFVSTAIRIWHGLPLPEGIWMKLRLDGTHRTADRAEFVRCVVTSTEDGPKAVATSAQGSFGLRSVANADVLVLLPAHTLHESGEIRNALVLNPNLNGNVLCYH